LAAVLVTGGMFVRMILEERFLRTRYPEYGAFCASTKRFVPFLF